MRRIFTGFAIAILALELTSVIGIAQLPPHPAPTPPPSLKTVKVPLPVILGVFVVNNEAAIRLGKALFWDLQVGGDGQTACASCHFQAGADTRITGNLNPGPNHAFDFGGPNHTYSAMEFPFHQLVDPEDRGSARIRSVDDVSGGAGVHASTFIDILRGTGRDDQSVAPDANGFSLSGRNLRQVTGRNTPSFINSIFNVRNFWDGRANRRFNGVSPFGDFDVNARIMIVNDLGELEEEPDSDDHSSLASLATGPPNNNVEMSAAGRDFARLGKKMLSLQPLGMQKVHGDDSVLGELAVTGGRGLNTSYVEMIKEAYDPEYWDSNKIVDGAHHEIPGVLNSTIGAGDATLASGQFTLMESNFAMFWGYAILMYGSTLVSDDAPFDQFAEGHTNALTAQQQFGLKLFMNSSTGNCITCHSGPEFSSATFSARLDSTTLKEGMIRRMVMADGRTGVYDGGFYNIGVRPTSDDVGLGASDPFGNPLSLARQEQLHPGSIQDNELSPAINPSERVVADGMFKTPTLRNVELNGPYFHNGSIAKLSDVVQFYSRGGNFHDENIANLDVDIHRQRGLIGHPMRKLAITDFIRGLTDERVRYNRAPFDHPEIVVQAGAPGNEVSVLADLAIAGQAANATFTLPAVGRNGGDAIQPFLNLPVFDPSPIAVPNPVFSGMALFATDSLFVGTRRDTEGDLWSNGVLRIAGATGSRTMNGDITAGGDVIVRGDSTIINGSIMARGAVSLSPGSGVTLPDGLVGSYVEFYAPLAMPTLPSVVGRGRSVVVLENSTLRLVPGSYQSVLVGRKGRLILSDGQYVFRNLTMRPLSTLSYDEFGQRDQLTQFGEIPIAATERTTINILDQLMVQAGATITSGDAERSTHLRINVLDARDKEGRLSMERRSSEDEQSGKVILFQSRSVFHGSLVAPRAKVIMAEGASLQGAIYARAIEINDRCVIRPHHLPADAFTPASVAGGLSAAAVSAAGPEGSEGPVVAIPSTLASSANLGLEFALTQNHPNPFRPSTVIRFALPEARDVRLEVFDIGGRMVKTLAKGTLGPGLHTLSWNGTGDRGTRLPAGVYLYRLMAGKDQANRKLILTN